MPCFKIEAGPPYARSCYCKSCDCSNPQCVAHAFKVASIAGTIRQITSAHLIPDESHVPVESSDCQRCARGCADGEANVFSWLGDA